MLLDKAHRDFPLHFLVASAFNVQIRNWIALNNSFPVFCSVLFELLTMLIFSLNVVQGALEKEVSQRGRFQDLYPHLLADINTNHWPLKAHSALLISPR